MFPLRRVKLVFCLARAIERTEVECIVLIMVDIRILLKKKNNNKIEDKNRTFTSCYIKILADYGGKCMLFSSNLACNGTILTALKGNKSRKTHICIIKIGNVQIVDYN